jgi:hypothetical protein
MKWDRAFFRPIWTLALFVIPIPFLAAEEVRHSRKIQNAIEKKKTSIVLTIDVEHTSQLK